MPCATVSIDIDGIGCYHAIHGLPAPAGSDPMYTQAMPRFLDLVSGLRIKTTLFAVGRDVEAPAAAGLLRRAIEAGHEVANHSHNHDYRLIQQPAIEIESDLTSAHRAIEEVTGVAPHGFRAPGYNVSDAVLDALERLGYRYDSSIFPAPGYFALRALAIGYYRLRGQSSRSLVGDPRQFLAPRRPYRPRLGKLFGAARGDQARRLIELPIAVATPARLPFIGTSLTLAPDLLGAQLSRLILRERAPINLELHAIDFLDRTDPGVDPELAARQRDLQLPAATKIRRLRAIIGELAARREVMRLDDLALRSVIGTCG